MNNIAKKDKNGIEISEKDLSAGKVMINNIEITSIEDWNKIIKLLNELQQENKQLKEQLQLKEDIINKAKEYIENNPLYDIDVYEYSICLNGIDDEQTKKDLLKILDNKGDENNGL